MFKAKLIDKKEYYSLRSKQALLLLLPSIPMALLINFVELPWYLTALAFGVYVLSFIYIYKNQKIMSTMMGQKIIEIDKNEIRIKSKKGKPKEIIYLENIDKIIVKDDYGIHQETMLDLKNEIIGQPKENFLIIEHNNEKRKFDFELDSHYMITQLNKIINGWTNNGLKIERRA